jgi:hypothetical protein
MIESYLKNSIKKSFLIFSVIFFIIYFFKLKISFIPKESYLLITFILFFLGLYFYKPKEKLNSYIRKIIVIFTKNLSFSLLCLYLISFFINYNIDNLNPYPLLFLITFFSIIFFLKTSKITDNNIEYFHQKESLYRICIGLIFLVFLTLTIGIPFYYKGSYLDEYFHISSAMDLLSTGHFSQFSPGQYYYRGSYVSIMVAIIFYLIKPSIYIAKMVPAMIGIINFYLLYQICKNSLESRLATLYCLLIFTFSPWFIFNHFYIRMNIFYEFFILFLTILFIKLDQNFENIKKIQKLIIIILVTLGIITFFSKDLGAYLLLVYSSIFFLYFYFTKINKIKINNLTYIKLDKIKKIIILFLFCCVSFYLFNIADLVQRLLSGSIKYSSDIDLKYDNLFFNLNFIFTLLFLTSFILLFSEKIKPINKIIIFSTGVLFTLHMISSKDIQLTRTIIYLLPLYYLVALISFENLIKNYNSLFFTVLITLLFFLNIASNYPEKFFTNGPYIPSEVFYKDYQEASAFLIKECSNRKIISMIHEPFVLNFYSVNISDQAYMLKELLPSDDRYYYNNEQQKYVTVKNNIPTMTDYQTLLNLNPQSNCIIAYPEARDYMRYYKQQDMENLNKKFNKINIGNKPSFIIYY